MQVNKGEPKLKVSNIHTKVSVKIRTITDVQVRHNLYYTLTLVCVTHLTIEILVNYNMNGQKDWLF